VPEIVCGMITISLRDHSMRDHQFSEGGREKKFQFACSAFPLSSLPHMF
jgi:hypothetical protein